MKEYRNVRRSKKLIKDALITLLKTKDISKISVMDLVREADLSRNTFYAHYQDIYSVLEEIEGEIIKETVTYLDDYLDTRLFNDPLGFFNNIVDFVSKNTEGIKVLLTNNQSLRFIDKLKVVLIERVMGYLDSKRVHDKKGFLIFLDFLFSGFIEMVQQYLANKNEVNLSYVAQETTKIYKACAHLYISVY